VDREKNISIAAGQRIRREALTDMGFGMLFIGYFLLINITYFEYTDIIAAMLMLMAAYKLSFVN
jgi:hypothetical protein